MTYLSGPFRGSEAIAAGLVRKHELRSKYFALHPDVYFPTMTSPTFRQRAGAAWLWSRRSGVLAGRTAARLHGAKWVDDDEPIELIPPNGRPPTGIRTYQARLNSTEYGLRASLPTTTVLRTAYDMGRRGKLGDAIAHLDALGNATGMKAEAVADLAAAHPERALTSAVTRAAGRWSIL